VTRDGYRRTCSSCACSTGLLTKLCNQLGRDLPLVDASDLRGRFGIDNTKEAVDHFLQYHLSNHNPEDVISGKEELGPEPFVLEIPRKNQIALMSYDPRKTCVLDAGIRSAGEATASSTNAATAGDEMQHRYGCKCADPNCANYLLGKICERVGVDIPLFDAVTVAAGLGICMARVGAFMNEHAISHNLEAVAAGTDILDLSEMPFVLGYDSKERSERALFSPKPGHGWAFIGKQRGADSLPVM